MSEEQDKSPFETRKCHICGNADYTWGRLVDSHNVERQVKFAAKSVSDYRAAFADGKSEVFARVCNTCGNMQTFVNVPVTTK